MDVRAVLVILAVLMPLLQASGQTVNINLNIGGSTGGRGTADKSQNVVTALLLEQNKKMQERDEDMQEELQERDKKMHGYERFCEKPDMCYKFSDYKNYTDASSDCQAAGGHLVMPKDQATKDFLSKQLRARYIMNIWIGLTDEVTEGTWMWEDGTTLGTGWNNWAQGYPNPNDHAMNCAKLYNSEWFHVGCSSTMNYICEVKATATP
ncbi:Collectin-11 [Branchiostoma belcheri]|nr:Collectin-11 [Branchiostoma belcheri]